MEDTGDNSTNKQTKFSFLIKYYIINALIAVKLDTHID